LNSKEALEAMEFVKSLKWTYDILTVDPAAENWASGFSALATGKAAMYIAANDAVAVPTEQFGLSKDKLALVPMPAGPAGRFMLMGGTPYMFIAGDWPNLRGERPPTDDEVEGGLDYLELMGKGPVITEEIKADWEADALERKNKGIPVIPNFPIWLKPDVLEAEATILKKYGNIDMANFSDYFEAIKKPGVLHVEEPGDTQAMYEELTTVLQAVFTDKNADVQALMDAANTNLQKILDEGLNR